MCPRGEGIPLVVEVSQAGLALRGLSSIILPTRVTGYTNTWEHARACVIAQLQCVCARARERERARESERDRQADRQRAQVRERARARDRERDREKAIFRVTGMWPSAAQHVTCR